MLDWTTFTNFLLVLALSNVCLLKETYLVCESGEQVWEYTDNTKKKKKWGGGLYPLLLVKRLCEMQEIIRILEPKDKSGNMQWILTEKGPDESENGESKR